MIAAWRMLDWQEPVVWLFAKHSLKVLETAAKIPYIHSRQCLQYSE